MTYPRIPAVLALTALAGLAGGAHAAEPGSWQSFISISPVHQGGADIDDGGRFRAGGAIVRGGASRDLGGGVRAGIALNYDYRDYSFSRNTAFGTTAPWGTVQRYGISVPLSFALDGGWSIGIAPSVDWFKENGAKSSDSLAWGAMFSGTRQFESGNRIGLGVGVFSQIEKTSAFPFVIVDWRLNDRWRLTNPLPSGPTGPAGLEIDYRFDGGWTAGVGVAYRVNRFRLSDSGPVSNGVGEERGVPVFLRLTRNLSPQLALHLYGGVVTNGRLRVENSSGRRLQTEKFGSAPLVGLSLIGRF